MNPIDSMTRKKIGRWVRSFRTSLGWTQRRAAKAVGITPVHLCLIEKGDNMPSLALLERMATELSVSMPWDKE